jgi:hypothetical protein
MNFREMNLRVFQRKPIPHVFFQPRIEPWIHWHKIFGTTPPAYRYESANQVFDALDCSMRYVHYYTDMPDPVVVSFDPKVVIKTFEDEERQEVIYQTPYGDLHETRHFTIDHTWRTVGFAVKNREDLRALTWLHQHLQFHFDAGNFIQGSDYMGERGEPQFWVPKSPYQALAQIWMKLQDLIYALADYPKEVEASMAAIDASYDPLYQEIARSGLVKIVNFGENIHEQLLSPGYLKHYLLPFWEARVAQLHAAGIFTHVHIDGYFNNLLPTLKELPFDGIEALTPVPQGDMTLEAIKAQIGDKVLLDGIPAVLFTDTYSREELMQTTERIIEMFSPNLVLGISDELPEGAGLEAIERVRLIAAMCKKRPSTVAGTQESG